MNSLLKLICNSNPYDIFVVISGHAQSGEDLNHPVCKFPAEVAQGGAPPSFSSHCQQCPFRGLVTASFFTFLGLLVVMLLFKWPG